MNRNHFRTGNILQDAKGKIAIVEEITKDDGVKAYSGMITSLPLKPIPIVGNEYLLEQLGFDDSEYKTGYIGKEYKNKMILDFVITKPGKMGVWQKNYCFELRDNRFVELEFIYQLQNLYLDLTGIELILLKQS